MALTLWSDATPADWIAHSDLPWTRLVAFGPDGFEAYARPRFLPDPTREGQSENEAVGTSSANPLLLLWRILAETTTTPDDCWFCVWEGYDGPGAPVVVPHRAYWLFRGRLADVGAWETAEGWPSGRQLDAPEPAFTWPVDHAWCVAKDVDPHWAGIGGSRALVDHLVRDPRLDVVPADPSQEQPLYTG